MTKKKRLLFIAFLVTGFGVGLAVAGRAWQGSTPSAAEEAQLDLTGAQAKAIVRNCEAFTKNVSTLSIGVSQDLTQYQMRLLHVNAPSYYVGIFDKKGVTTPVPDIYAHEAAKPDVLIDGDEMKALVVVTDFIRSSKRFTDYDITNYIVSITRTPEVIQVHCGASIMDTCWPKVSAPNGIGDVAEYGMTQTSPSLRFDVSRKSFQIMKRSIMPQ